MATESTGRADLQAAVEALGGPRSVNRGTGAPIVAAAFGGPGAPLVLVGGIHGDEPATVEALLELAAARRAARWPCPLWLLPAVNPDGLARGLKNSARDVDLNRNFPARSFTRAHAPGYFPGAAPLSEPETRRSPT